MTLCNVKGFIELSLNSSSLCNFLASFNTFNLFIKDLLNGLISLSYQVKQQWLLSANVFRKIQECFQLSRSLIHCFLT